MRILVLRDKKPGHYHQAEGIAAAAARIEPNAIERLDVRPRRLAHDMLRRRLLGWFLHRPELGLRLFYGIDARRIAPFDMIVGSGRPTIAAGVLLSRLLGVPFVYSGWPDGYDPDVFGLILVDSPRKAGAPNAAFVPVPSLIDPTALPKPKALKAPADLRGAELALLIGGEAHSHHYRPEDWAKLVTFIVRTSETLGIRWHVATSRRTPPEMRGRLEALLAEGRIVEFVDFERDGPGSADRLYGADAVVVTEDSISMLSEALTARRPAVALAPSQVKKTSDFEWVAVEAAAGHVAVMPIATATPERFADALVDLAPPEDDVRGRIASALRKVVPHVDGAPRVPPEDRDAAGRGSDRFAAE